MTKVTIDPGVCGFVAKAIAEMNGEMCTISVKCGCPHICTMVDELKEVNPMTEISFKQEGSALLKSFEKNCPHPSCPIPSGILKAIEVEAGLALPQDASIKFDN